MRKAVSVLMILTLMLLLCGCGGNGGNNAAEALPRTEEASADEVEAAIKVEEAIPSPQLPVSVHDEIVFGTYEQDNDTSNGPEPIEWVVLDVEDDHVLLLSKFCLDCRPYHDKEDLAGWQNCSLREWMNSSFYDEAFSEDDKPLIQLTHVVNSDCKDTYDWVYLMSYDEMIQYFEKQPNARCDATEYAVKQGVEVNGKTVRYYWLRSVSERKTTIDSYGKEIYSTKADVVSSDGYGKTYGPITSKISGIRPVMWIQWDERLAG